MEKTKKKGKQNKKYKRWRRKQDLKNKEEIKGINKLREKEKKKKIVLHFKSNRKAHIIDSHAMTFLFSKTMLFNVLNTT